MIKSVEVQNFKSLREQRIELERLTVFVGANASGKTSILEVVRLASRAANFKSKGRNQRSFDWLYTRGGTGELAITCTTSGGVFKVSAQPPDGFPPQQSECLGKCLWDISVSSPKGTAPEDAIGPARSVVFLNLNATKLAQPSYSDRESPRMESDGDGLASVLAYMALTNPDNFAVLVGHMQKLIPDLRRIRFRKSEVERVESELVRFGNDSVERRSRRVYQGDAILFDFKNAVDVAAHTASEGTLLLLGM